MATRVKKAAKTAKTREEIEGVMSDYATAESKYQKLTASMELAITAIRDKNEAELTELKSMINEKVDDLQLFAETNPDLFEKVKSLDMVHGSIGFRTGTPKLKLLRKLTLKDVLILIKKKLPNYIRVKVELSKDKLISDREKKEVNKHFDYCGIEVVQEETFFVELKKEGAE